VAWKFPECEDREAFTSLTKWSPECLSDHPKNINFDVMMKSMRNKKMKGVYRKCRWLLGRDLCPRGLKPIYE